MLWLVWVDRKRKPESFFTLSPQSVYSHEPPLLGFMGC